MTKQQAHEVAARMLAAKNLPRSLAAALDRAHDYAATGDSPEYNGGDEPRSTQVIASIVVAWELTQAAERAAERASMRITGGLP